MKVPIPPSSTQRFWAPLNAGGVYGFFLLHALVVSMAILTATLPVQAATESVIHSFANAADGQNPSSGLVRDKNGVFYGTTTNGGRYGLGTIYSLTKGAAGSWVKQTLHSFAPSEGSDPLYGTLIMDTAGNLYGSTEFGGIPNCGTGFGCGTVYELSPPVNGGSWTLATLYAFTGLTDGGLPSGGLVLDPSGALYGTAANGGDLNYPCAPYGCGVVFKLTPPKNGGTSWTLQVLHAFNGFDGTASFSSLTRDSHGSLYGTNSLGGAHNYGNVFKVTPSKNGWTERTIYDFTGVDGDQPVAGVTIHNGALYGATLGGGNFEMGNVFQLTPNSDGTWTEVVLYSFTGTDDGGLPYADLIFDQAGNLYGTAYEGYTGNCPFGGCGNVFELTPSNGSWIHTNLYTFQPSGDGYFPTGRLLFDQRNGILYGTTHNGGGNGQGCQNGCGAVFQLTLP